MTDVIRQLNTVPKRNGAEAAQMLRDMAERAEAGEIIAVSGIVEYASGGYGQFGSATLSRLQTAGALLEAAVKRLGFID